MWKYKVLFKLEGLLLNNSFNDKPCNECFPMGEDLNHLTFCIINFSRICKLARPEKSLPIIKFYHLSYSSKSFPPFFSVEVRLKHERISCFHIYIALEPKVLWKNKTTHSVAVYPCKVIWDCSKNRHFLY